MAQSKSCPCSSAKPFAMCCGPMLAGQQSAVTAEQLMRSRYSAYVEHDIDYILNTWHSSTRPAEIDPGTLPKWCSLQIVRCAGGGREEEQGVVEFIALSLSGSQLAKLHEVSSFVREEGQWFYVSGTFPEASSDAEDIGKIGRKSPCACGSGKKFKRCCGP